MCHSVREPRVLRKRNFIEHQTVVRTFGIESAKAVLRGSSPDVGGDPARDTGPRLWASWMNLASTQFSELL
jgi:hypothetical protein